MDEKIQLIMLGLAVGFALGYLAAWLRRGKGVGDAIRVRTQLEERDRRVGELEASLVGKEKSLADAAEERTALEARLAATRTELDGARTQADEKLALLEDARAKLEQAFKAAAGESLRANSETFMNLARAKMEALLSEAEGNLERRREAFEKLLRPVSDTLARYEQDLKAVEKARTDAYGGLRDQVRALAEAEQTLRKETANLVHALRMPQTRGRWGELTLRRAVELAGMSAHCDFSEQVAVSTSEGKQLRPDMVIHLPGDREVVVDSKVSLDAYLNAVEATSETERKNSLTRHASQVRSHMVSLASKEYGRQFDKAPEFTVLFLPGESFFSAAAEQDPALIEAGMKRGVIIATPTTLVALLRAVALGWRQAGLEENAKKISEAGRELYDRCATLLEHFEKVGGALGRAVRSYNDAVGSFERRFLPAARKFKELGATAAKNLPEPECVDEAPRAPSAET